MGNELRDEKRAQVVDGDLYAWVQTLFKPDLDTDAGTFTVSKRKAKSARLWVCRRGQRPTETVFSIESIKSEDAQAVADAINGNSQS